MELAEDVCSPLIRDVTLLRQDDTVGRRPTVELVADGVVDQRSQRPTIKTISDDGVDIDEAIRRTEEDIRYRLAKLANSLDKPVDGRRRRLLPTPPEQTRTMRSDDDREGWQIPSSLRLERPLPSQLGARNMGLEIVADNSINRQHHDSYNYMVSALDDKNDRRVGIRNESLSTEELFVRPALRPIHRQCLTSGYINPESDNESSDIDVWDRVARPPNSEKRVTFEGSSFARDSRTAPYHDTDICSYDADNFPSVRRRLSFKDSDNDRMRQSAITDERHRNTTESNDRRLTASTGEYNLQQQMSTTDRHRYRNAARRHYNFSVDDYLETGLGLTGPDAADTQKVILGQVRPRDAADACLDGHDGYTSTIVRSSDNYGGLGGAMLTRPGRRADTQIGTRLTNTDIDSETGACGVPSKPCGRSDVDRYDRQQNTGQKRVSDIELCYSHSPSSTQDRRPPTTTERRPHQHHASTVDRQQLSTPTVIRDRITVQRPTRTTTRQTFSTYNDRRTPNRRLHDDTDTAFVVRTQTGERPHEKRWSNEAVYGSDEEKHMSDDDSSIDRRLSVRIHSNSGRRVSVSGVLSGTRRRT